MSLYAAGMIATLSLAGLFQGYAAFGLVALAATGVLIAWGIRLNRTEG